MTDRALKRIPRNDRPHKLDGVGAALMVAAALALLLALSWGGVRYPWNSAAIVALLVGSVALWAAFAWWLTRAPEPFIPLSLVGERLIALMVIAAFFAIGTIIGLSIVVPLYLELVLGFSASGGGIALIAYVVGTSFGSLSSGRLMSRLAHYKRIPLTALPFSIATFLLLAWQPAGWSLPSVCAILAVNGYGVGTMYPFSTVTIQNAVEPHRFGVATGTLNFFRQLGGAIITAAFVAIVLGGLEGGEGARLIETVTAPGANAATRAAGAAHFAPLFGVVFLAAAVLLTASMLAVMLAEERPLRGPATRVKTTE
jgi:MFS family permease